MASSKEDLMLVVAMLLPEEKEENQIKKRNKSYIRMDFEHFSKVVDYLSKRLHGQSNDGLGKAS